MERSRDLLLAERGWPGRGYLRSRKLNPDTWAAARLGLTGVRDTQDKFAWVITLPWLYQDHLTAIQYRFIRDQEQRYDRFGYDRYFGETILYTLPRKMSDTLVIVEGEFNALSIWQELPVDVVSFGSQSITTHTFESLRHMRDDYRRLLVWADEAQVTADVILGIGGNAQPIGTDADANELLQAGTLAEIFASQT